MELRARIRRSCAASPSSAALAALLVPAARPADAGQEEEGQAPVDHQGHADAAPRRRHPDHHAASNFRRGRNKNTVVFKRDGGRAVFVKADIGTDKLLRSSCPHRSRSALVDAATAAGRRPASACACSRPSSAARSPRPSARRSIGPAEGSRHARPPARRAPTATATATASPTARHRRRQRPAARHARGALKTDPCKADTDGDGVPDGYEYRSALDLNDDEYQQPSERRAPVPGQAAVPERARPDRRQQRLRRRRAHARRGVRPLAVHDDAASGAPYDLSTLTYSDGTQYSLYARDASGRRRPSQPVVDLRQAQPVRRLGRRQRLRAHRDPGPRPHAVERPVEPGHRADVQHLRRQPRRHAATRPPTTTTATATSPTTSATRTPTASSNFDETHGADEPELLDQLLLRRAPYLIKYAGTSVTDPDTDGDGVRDGADDQDFDGFPNIMELSRTAASGRFDGKGPCIAARPAARA